MNSMSTFQNLQNNNKTDEAAYIWNDADRNTNVREEYDFATSNNSFKKDRLSHGKNSIDAEQTRILNTSRNSKLDEIADEIPSFHHQSKVKSRNQASKVNSSYSPENKSRFSDGFFGDSDEDPLKKQYLALVLELERLKKTKQILKRASVTNNPHNTNKSYTPNGNNSAKKAVNIRKRKLENSVVISKKKYMNSSPANSASNPSNSKGTPTIRSTKSKKSVSKYEKILTTYKRLCETELKLRDMIQSIFVAESENQLTILQMQLEIQRWKRENPKTKPGLSIEATETQMKQLQKKVWEPRYERIVKKLGVTSKKRNQLEEKIVNEKGSQIISNDRFQRLQRTIIHLMEKHELRVQNKVLLYKLEQSQSLQKQEQFLLDDATGSLSSAFLLLNKKKLQSKILDTSFEQSVLDTQELCESTINLPRAVPDCDEIFKPIIISNNNLEELESISATENASDIDSNITPVIEEIFPQDLQNHQSPLLEGNAASSIITNTKEVTPKSKLSRPSANIARFVSKNSLKQDSWFSGLDSPRSATATETSHDFIDHDLSKIHEEQLSFSSLHDLDPSLDSPVSSFHSYNDRDLSYVSHSSQLESEGITENSVLSRLNDLELDILSSKQNIHEEEYSKRSILKHQSFDELSKRDRYRLARQLQSKTSKNLQRHSLGSTHYEDLTHHNSANYEQNQSHSKNFTDSLSKHSPLSKNTLESDPSDVILQTTDSLLKDASSFLSSYEEAQKFEKPPSKQMVLATKKQDTKLDVQRSLSHRFLSRSIEPQDYTSRSRTSSTSSISAVSLSSAVTSSSEITTPRTPRAIQNRSRGNSKSSHESASSIGNSISSSSSGIPITKNIISKSDKIRRTDRTPNDIKTVKVKLHDNFNLGREDAETSRKKKMPFTSIPKLNLKALHSVNGNRQSEGASMRNSPIGRTNSSSKNNGRISSEIHHDSQKFKLFRDYHQEVQSARFQSEATKESQNARTPIPGLSARYSSGSSSARLRSGSSSSIPTVSENLKSPPITRQGSRISRANTLEKSESDFESSREDQIIPTKSKASIPSSFVSAKPGVESSFAIVRKTSPSSVSHQSTNSTSSSTSPSITHTKQSPSSNAPQSTSTISSHASFLFSSHFTEIGQPLRTTVTLDRQRSHPSHSSSISQPTLSTHTSQPTLSTQPTNSSQTAQSRQSSLASHIPLQHSPRLSQHPNLPEETTTQPNLPPRSQLSRGDSYVNLHKHPSFKYNLKQYKSSTNMSDANRIQSEERDKHWYENKMMELKNLQQRLQLNPPS